MYSKFLITLIAACASLGTKAQYYSSNSAYPQVPKRETRAVWLTTFANLDWPKTRATSPDAIEQQKQELTDMLDAYQKANINTVLLQARVRAATIYPSNIEPWDKCITGVEGQDPGFGYDPLKFAVEECHKRGMSIQAWIATIPVGGRNSLGCKTIESKGYRTRYLSTGAYLDPSDPGVPAYLAQVCAEITKNYDIDGINLDYIRYPDGWPKPTYQDGDTPDDRRANITAIVKAIHDAVKSIKPWVRLACSPIGKYADLNKYSSKNYNAHDRVFQEAQDWLRTGLMDELYPMQYFRGTNYYPFLADWDENRYSHEIVSGLGTYFLDYREGNWSLSEVQRQMNVSRGLGMGHAHYRSYYLTSNQQGIYDFEQEFNPNPSLSPSIPSKNTVAAPNYANGASNLVVSTDDTSNHLVWTGSAPYYNIYTSDKKPVDIDNPENLVYARYDGTSLNIAIPDAASNTYFAVTAVDRYGNESKALQGEGTVTEQQPSEGLLQNDGNSLQLPAKMANLNVKSYVISDNLGNEVRQVPTIGKDMTQIYIYALKNGFYTLSALFPNSKQATPIGKFIVKK